MKLLCDLPNIKVGSVPLGGVYIRNIGIIGNNTFIPLDVYNKGIDLGFISQFNIMVQILSDTSGV